MVTVETFDMNKPVKIATSAIAARVAADALTDTIEAVGAADRLERDLLTHLRDALSDAADTAVSTVELGELMTS